MWQLSLLNAKYKQFREKEQLPDGIHKQCSLLGLNNTKHFSTIREEK